MVPFFAVVILAAFTALFPPTRLARFRWIAAIAALCVAKLALSWFLIDEGWRGTYGTSADWAMQTRTMRQAEFMTEHGVRPYRIDRSIDFDGPTFGLTFINDVPPETAPYLPESREVHYPMRVRWTSYAAAPFEARTTISAAGHVRVSAGGKVHFDAMNPRGAPLLLAVSEAERRLPIEVEYLKPEASKPSISISGIPVRVFVTPITPSEVQRNDIARIAVTLIGLAALTCLFLAFTDAWPRLSVVALEEIWRWPVKISAVLFFAFFIATGLVSSVRERHITVELGLRDDPIIYEAQARQIIQNGPLMVDGMGRGKPYYFYPLYPYGLAAAHMLMGDDYSNVRMFNYICLASIAFFVWALLKDSVSAGTGVLTIIFTALFVVAYYPRYANSSFTDNLYVVTVLAAVTASAAALSTYRPFALFVTGVLAALAAAARPSFLLYVPVFAMAMLFRRDAGTVRQRVLKSLQFGTGFTFGVAPFTIRNWIVSRKFVLLVSSFIMLPYFLFAPEETVPGLNVGRNRPNLTQSLGQFIHIWASRPWHTAWVELRKLLFTFGYMGAGPSASQQRAKFLWIYPIIFLVAISFRRVPRRLRDAILIFAASHVLAMVLAAPWTYGYKTILPFDLVLLIGGLPFLLPRWGETREPSGAHIEARRLPGRPIISVVLPTYNEKDSIRQSILDFFATGIVDEVLVINNNAVAGTSDEVAGTGAIEIFERRQGYGAAIRRGLVEAKGDYIVICEPDGTFLARDIQKLLAYADDFDVVYGSRTSQQFVWHGANMGLFLRWGNYFVAKYLEFLYNATSLTDVGCTYRLIRRDVALAMMDQFRIDGNQFGPEMMILTLRAGYRVIQIPLNYLPRVGESSVTGDPLKALILGLQMIWLITSRRFEHLFTPPPGNPAPQNPAPAVRTVEAGHGQG